MVEVSNLEFKSIIMSAYEGTLGVNKNGKGEIIFHTQSYLTGDFTGTFTLMCDDKIGIITFDKGKVKSFSVSDKDMWRGRQ